MSELTIGELNMRVTVENWVSAQDGTGNVSSTLTSSWVKWMKVDMDNGNRVLDQAGIVYKESYTCWSRYEKSRPTLPRYHLTFYNKELTVHSVVRLFVGKIWWEKIIAYTTL